MQASSATEALLMSPRSVDSTATKLPTATSCLSSSAGPAPLALSPSGPFPLDPASMGSLPSGPTLMGAVALETSYAGLSSPDVKMSSADLLRSQQTAADMSPEASRAQDLAGSVSTQQHSSATRPVKRSLQFEPSLVAQVPADQPQDGAHNTAHDSNTAAPAAAEASKLIMPFKAGNLQQLAQAVLDSKKAATMQQLVQQLQASSLSAAGSDRAASSQQQPGHWQLQASSRSSRQFASSDRAATAAWQLFDPMHVEAQGQLAASSGAGQGLVEGIAQAMCGIQGTCEMALLWLEVSHDQAMHSWLNCIEFCKDLAPSFCEDTRCKDSP